MFRHRIVLPKADVPDNGVTDNLQKCISLLGGVARIQKQQAYRRPKRPHCFLHRNSYAISIRGVDLPSLRIWINAETN